MAQGLADMPNYQYQAVVTYGVSELVISSPRAPKFQNRSEFGRKRHMFQRVPVGGLRQVREVFIQVVLIGFGLDN